jgi:hypothetical protein
MRSILVVTLLLSTMPAQTTDAPNVIIAQEYAFWKAYVNGNRADLAKILLPDFTNVEEQIWGRDQVIAFVGQFHEHCSLAPIKVLDPRVTFPRSDVATLVYHATETATCGTRTVGSETNVSSVWLYRDGEWKMHLHTEYAIPSK